MDDTPKSRLKYYIQTNTFRKPKTRTCKINYDLICKYSRNCNKVTKNSNVQTLYPLEGMSFSTIFSHFTLSWQVQNHVLFVPYQGNDNLPSAL